MPHAEAAIPFSDNGDYEADENHRTLIRAAEIMADRTKIKGVVRAKKRTKKRKPKRKASLAALARDYLRLSKGWDNSFLFILPPVHCLNFSL